MRKRCGQVAQALWPCMYTECQLYQCGNEHYGFEASCICRSVDHVKLQEDHQKLKMLLLWRPLMSAFLILRPLHKLMIKNIQMQYMRCLESYVYAQSKCRSVLQYMQIAQGLKSWNITACSIYSSDYATSCVKYLCSHDMWPCKCDTQHDECLLLLHMLAWSWQILLRVILYRDFTHCLAVWKVFLQGVWHSLVLLAPPLLRQPPEKVCTLQTRHYQQITPMKGNRLSAHQYCTSTDLQFDTQYLS